MPPLSLNKMIGLLRFQSKGLKMPLEYDFVQQPMRNHYMRSLAPEAQVGVPHLYPRLFTPHMNVKPQQDMCCTLGQHYKTMLDYASDFMVYGHNLWRLQAKFGPMPIAAAMATGTPGCLIAPKLAPLVRQHPQYSSLTEKQKPYLNAVSKGASDVIDMWGKNVTVTLPLFPSFVMQPPGSAVPTPNVPQKLIACVSSGVSALVVPNIMKEAMCAEFDPTGKVHEVDKTFFESVATVYSLGFTQWLSNQMVVGVIGTGAVASITGGPVAGVTMPTSGHLVA